MSPARRLTPPEVLQLRQTGPFTRDPMLVKLVLDPVRVQQRRDEWLVAAMGYVKQAMRRSKIDDPRNLTVAKIARSQAGRPAVSTDGSTYFELAKPLLDTDTKAHADAVSINDYTEQLCPDADQAAEHLASMYPAMPPHVQAALSDSIASRMGTVAILQRGDGQTIITMANEKKAQPETFKKVVPSNGGFHATGHFAFCAMEGFWDCKYGRTVRLLGKEKVHKHTPNFESDSYKHVTTHIREDHIGTLSYFLLDVKSPPPELLLDDPLAYLDQLKSAGGVAAFESLRCVGVPLQQWMLASRSGDGELARDCEAYSFHTMRAWAFKPVETRVLLISLLGMETTHPKIAEVVRQTAFFNWLGKDGQAQFADRAMEYINLLQDQRRGKFAAFEHALEYTPALAALVHTVHALDAADHGESASNDPLRESMITAAEAIRADLVARLGTDLTVPDPTNPLFHTGGAPNMVNATSVVSHRPWEQLWRVAEKQSAGEGRGKKERWNAYVDRFIRENLWTCHDQ